MTTTYATLETAYDSLSYAVASYKGAVGSELARELEHVRSKHAALANLLETKLRKGKAEGFRPRCEFLLGNASNLIESFGPDTVRRSHENRKRRIENHLEEQNRPLAEGERWITMPGFCGESMRIRVQDIEID